jgi:hypothetical protein
MQIGSRLKAIRRLSCPGDIRLTPLIITVVTLLVSATSFSQASDLGIAPELTDTQQADAQLKSPTLFRAVYKADYKGLPVSAVGIRELTNTKPGEFKLTSSAKSFFATIEESTSFQWSENSLVPLEYHYSRRGVGKNRRTSLSFDWDAQLLSAEEAEPWEMALVHGTLDKLLYQLKLRTDLESAHKAEQPWPELSYDIADDGRLKHYEFEVIGEEALETPIGTINTIKTTRVNNKKDRKTIFWLAPEYEFLLVKFRQQDAEGRGFELRLQEATFGGQAL